MREIATSGDKVYITLNVNPGEGVVVSQPAQASAIPATAKPLYTSTPAADGSISHVVGYGEALWSIAIAYGVKINTLRELNNLAVEFEYDLHWSKTACYSRRYVRPNRR